MTYENNFLPEKKKNKIVKFAKQNATEIKSEKKRKMLHDYRHCSFGIICDSNAVCHRMTLLRQLSRMLTLPYSIYVSNAEHKKIAL